MENNGPSADTILGQELITCACTECVDILSTRDAAEFCGGGGPDGGSGSGAIGGGGEAVCEGHDFTLSQCNDIPCCDFANGQCWSKVGRFPCYGGGIGPGSGHDDDYSGSGSGHDDDYSGSGSDHDDSSGDDDGEMMGCIFIHCAYEMQNCREDLVCNASFWRACAGTLLVLLTNPRSF